MPDRILAVMLERIIAGDCIIVEVPNPSASQHQRSLIGGVQHDESNIVVVEQPRNQSRVAIHNLLIGHPCGYLRERDTGEIAGGKDDHIGAGGLGRRFVYLDLTLRCRQPPHGPLNKAHSSIFVRQRQSLPKSHADVAFILHQCIVNRDFGSRFNERTDQFADGPIVSLPERGAHALTMIRKHHEFVRTTCVF